MYHPTPRTFLLLLMCILLLTGCKTKKAVIPTPILPDPECTLTDSVYTPPILPQAKMKGVWLTTIFGLDWPKISAHTPTGRKAQEAALQKILDECKEMGINTVFLQVRLRGDLLYPNGIEPLSRTISQTGELPSGYDPLHFAIDECHKRGMSLHAWMVIYPLGTDDNVQALASRRQGFWYAHRDLCVRQGNAWFMNPGEPAVRSHIGRLVRELVSRYSVDGVHLDYIRYPDGPRAFDDDHTFRKNNPHHLSKRAWREENISAMIDTLHHVLQEVAPHVALSTASIGKYRKLPAPAPGGFFCKDDVSQDPLIWFQRGIVDFIVPMLYYKDGHFTYYIEDWAELVAPHGQIIPGLGVYRLYDQSHWQIQDIVDQINLSEQYHFPGICYYRAEQMIQMKHALPEMLRAKIMAPCRRPSFGAAPTEGFGVVKITEVKTLSSNKKVQIKWQYTTTSEQQGTHRFNLYMRYCLPQLDCPLQLVVQSAAGDSFMLDEHLIPKGIMVEFFVEPTTFSGHSGPLSAGMLYEKK